MTRVRRDTHLPYYTENPRKNLHLLGKLTFPSNAGALLGKVVIEEFWLLLKEFLDPIFPPKYHIGHAWVRWYHKANLDHNIRGHHVVKYP